MTRETLPRLKDVFQALRRGQHICAADGETYRALEGHHDEFAALFRDLGFRFEHHRRGFYYFRGEDAMSETGRRLSVFMFVLVEWLGDSGRSIEESLLTQSFHLRKLTHLSHDRYRGYMAEAGVADEGQLERVLGHLERLGFVERITDDEFRFRTPVYRFLDLCLEFEEEDAG